jgi:hypothetical protein
MTNRTKLAMLAITFFAVAIIAAIVYAVINS